MCGFGFRGPIMAFSPSSTRADRVANASLPVLLVHLIDLCNLRRRPPALKFALEPDVDQLLRDLESDGLETHRDDLGIVACASPLRRIRVKNAYGAHTGDFVRHDGHPRARATHQNAAVILAFSDRFGH